MTLQGFGELELDLKRYELRRDGRVLRLEKIPMELLIFRVENKDKLVSREAIVVRLWGNGVFLDTEQGINTAVRKIRQTLHDDPEQPRFLQTVVGKGYRFVGPVRIESNGDQSVTSLSARSSASLIDNLGKNLSKGWTSWKSKAVLGTIVTLVLALLRSSILALGIAGSLILPLTPSPCCH